MKVKTIKRVCLCALALTLLVVTLASCGKQEIDTSWKSSDGEGCVNYFARILPLGDIVAEEGAITPREKFIAASRGYDMDAEDFDDSEIELGVTKDVDLDAAIAALEEVKPTDDASIIKFDELIEEMTADDVAQIVVRMGEEADLTEKSNPLVWIGKFLGVLTNLSGGNYVIALFYFAVIVELVLLYFGIRQQKNSIKQARLSPKERAIRKRYAGRNDQVSQRKMQEEIQRLYQEEGFNPMAGCLPLLIQMPIIIALYNIVIDPLRYVLGKAEGLSAVLGKFVSTSRAAGGLGESLTNTGKGTIELLSKLDAEKLEGLKNFAFYSNAGECYDALSGALGKMPNFNLFGLNMGLTPGFKPPYLLLLVPVLTFVAYFASMKLTRKFSYQPQAQDPQMGCSNNIMDITMPLMSVYITFITPAAVGIYWIFKCIIGVVKQFVLCKAMPLPTFTEEDYKRAEREMKGKARPQDRAPLPQHLRGTGRSLHSIDDEDELPPRVRESGEEADYISAEERRAMQQAAAREAQKNKSGVPMKSDRKNNKK